MLRKFLWVCLICLSLLLVSCGGNASTPVVNIQSPDPIPLSTDTPPVAPTLTPPPGRAVLVAGNEPEAAGLLAAMNELAAQAGLLLETRPSLQAAEITPDWRVVVFASLPVNLAELLAAAQQTQFAVVSSTDLAPGANLNVIRLRPERQAFLAGYTAMLAAPDYRTAGLLPGDTPLGALLQDAFRNGAGYYCGTCSPVYAPYVLFPSTVLLPSGSDAPTWQAGADSFEKDIIYVVYVSPQAARPEVLLHLVNKNLVLVGGQTPPHYFRSRWGASVREDAAAGLRILWPYLLARQGGQAVEAGLEVSDVNPEFLSEARLRLVEETRQTLLQRLLNPFTPPLQ
jgi:hypothetical protein